MIGASVSDVVKSLRDRGVAAYLSTDGAAPVFVQAVLFDDLSFSVTGAAGQGHVDIMYSARPDESRKDVAYRAANALLQAIHGLDVTWTEAVDAPDPEINEDDLKKAMNDLKDIKNGKSKRKPRG